jgi:hypothetical protein
MSTSRKFRLGLVLGAALLSGAGCASSGTQEIAAAGPPARIVVENTRRSGAAVSVQLVSSSGDRTLLGAVPPLGKEAFELDLRLDRAYRLVAESPEGRRIVSETFPLGPGNQIRWTIPFNSLFTPV